MERDENARTIQRSSVKEAQKAIVMELVKQNLVVKQTRIKHRTQYASVARTRLNS